MHVISIPLNIQRYRHVRSLTFKTSKGRTSPVFGNPAARKFLFESHGSALVGFHGRAASALDAIGAYFSASPSMPITGKKLKGMGGEGALWDDGVFDGIRKIHFGQNHDGVSLVKIEYNKGSQVIIGDGHGKKSLLGVETFELDYPSEYITTMGVNYDNVHGDKGGVTLVTSLIFKTNKQTSQPFGLGGGQYVELKEEGHKVVGFHGKAGDYVHQIGVYVAPITN